MLTNKHKQARLCPAAESSIAILRCCSATAELLLAQLLSGAFTPKYGLRLRGGVDPA